MIKNIVIYQIKNIENTMYAFRDFDENKFDFSDYENKYFYQIDFDKNKFLCQIPDGITKGDFGLLELIFEIFNGDKPDDFKGHSLSVSDIVKIDSKYYYCQSIGWKDITEYINE